MMHCLQLAGAPQELKIAVMEGSNSARRGLAASELDRLIAALLPDQPVVRLTDGQPVVRGRDDLHLSLSHATGATALAVAPFAIGIDIECVDPELDVLAIAPDLFGPRDFAFVQQQDAATRLEHFYRLWTLKEARLKQLGRTLADTALPEIIGNGANMSADWLALGTERYCVGVCWAGAVAPSAFLASANC
jgi:4'-phosphopantetheinyl transferase